MNARGWFLLSLLVGCGPTTDEPGTDDGANSGTTAAPTTHGTTSAGEADASGPSSTGTDSTGAGPAPVDCAPLDVDACEAEPACEPLWAQIELYYACVGEPFFAGCQPVDCPGSPCWICDGLSVEPRYWAPECGCLPAPWEACGGDANAPAQVEQCECFRDTECPESWQLCQDGFCVGCDDWIQQCNCSNLGCAPGRCCQSYCMPGDPLPDGTCPIR